MTQYRKDLLLLIAIGLALQGRRDQAVPTEPREAAAEHTFSARIGGERTLVVDNDGADCPQADFNSIQAAVAANR